MNIKRLNSIPQKYHEKAVTYFCNQEDLKSVSERHVFIFENPKFSQFNDFFNSKKESFK